MVLGHTAKSQPRGPALLVITPTRELAQQVAQVWRGGLRAATGLRCACVYGGVPREQQVASLAKLPHVLVATPGRLLDLGVEVVPAASCPEGVAVVVLDEADKMLSLGFEPQLARLHQLLLPATPAAAARWLHPDAVKVAVNSASAEAISKTITQVVQVCAEHKKPAKLLRHLVQDTVGAG
ncbi:uncharacterized protein HaLaN_24535 [Haematococcus lacustris]|uniref:Helicase ATP-binding domain-containing protein n=1 Tax=Haematococcus lacustris TaxID=44745 RepID=A0A699ZVA6_HAELA|nr:uncharacterized protein HaLaN_24535 [Haematococcus lacustris]